MPGVFRKLQDASLALCWERTNGGRSVSKSKECCSICGGGEVVPVKFVVLKTDGNYWRVLNRGQ